MKAFLPEYSQNSAITTVRFRRAVIQQIFKGVLLKAELKYVVERAKQCENPLLLRP